MASIAFGLLTTLTPHSGAGMWVGFQVIAGLGRGQIQQQPLTALQTVVTPAEIPTGNAFIMFIQLLGGALFLTFGQTLFANQLKTALAEFAPSVDAAKVFAVGATAFKTVVDESQVPNVILAYNQAITRIYVSFVTR